MGKYSYYRRASTDYVSKVIDAFVAGDGIKSNPSKSWRWESYDSGNRILFIHERPTVLYVENRCSEAPAYLSETLAHKRLSCRSSDLSRIVNTTADNRMQCDVLHTRMNLANLSIVDYVPSFYMAVNKADVVHFHLFEPSVEAKWHGIGERWNYTENKSASLHPQLIADDGERRIGVILTGSRRDASLVGVPKYIQTVEEFRQFMRPKELDTNEEYLQIGNAYLVPVESLSVENKTTYITLAASGDSYNTYSADKAVDINGITYVTAFIYSGRHGTLKLGTRWYRLLWGREYEIIYS